VKPPKINLVPKVVDLAVYAGDGTVVRITVNGGDMTDGVVEAQIRTHRLDADPVDEFAVDVTAEPGSVLLSLTGAQTEGLLNGNTGYQGAWDMQWTPTGHEPVTLVQGKLTVVADVTR
jgi:hypothetical protein